MKKAITLTPVFTYHNNTLCVRAGWLYGEAEVMAKHNYSKLRHRGQIRVVQRGCKGTPALVAYNSLPLRFREKIESQIGGHPARAVKRDSFATKIAYDTTAAEFFASHRFDNDKAVPEKKQREYVANASVLNAAQKAYISMRAIKLGMDGRIGAIWEQLVANIADLDKKTWPHSLPENVRRFKGRYDLYKTDGYISLVHKNFNNNNSEKIHQQAGIWVLSRWADQVNRIPNLAQLLVEYNNKTEQEGWKPLKAQETLKNFLYRGDIKHLWYGHRYGDMASKEKFAYQNSTKLPAMRDGLWYADGTKLNYYYKYIDNKDGKLKKGTCIVYEVMDAYAEVFLGYHISASEDYKSQYAAFKMAIQTAGHRPYEVKVDNQGGHKKLKTGNFLDQIARLAINTTPYNGKSKTIESAFGRFQRQYMKKDWFFTGQNVKAKHQESQQHKEFIAKQRLEDFPTLDEATAIYIQRRKEWNTAPHPATGISRIEMYHASHNPQAPALSEIDQINIFWVLRPKPVTYTAQGISFTEQHQEHKYVVMIQPGIPDIAWMRVHVDTKFFIRFDPDNMSLVNLYQKTGQDDLRFVTTAESKVFTHRGTQEQQAWEAEYYKKIKHTNDTERKAAYDTMDSLLSEYNARAEDYGLKSPKPLGLNSGNSSIGKVLKQESNAEEKEYPTALAEPSNHEDDEFLELI